MKLIKLKEYTQNDYDNLIIDRMSKDSEENLNKYIVNVISDLINSILMEESLKLSAKNNINNYDYKTIGEVSLYVSLIPYIQLQLKENKDGYNIINSFIEMLITYIVGYISKEEFDVKLYEIKEILKISNEFYDSLLNYFISKNQDIKDGLSKRI